MVWVSGVLLAVFLPQPTGMKPQDRPRTQWEDYISNVSWEHLGTPHQEQESVAVEKAVWNTLLSLLSPRPGFGYVENNGWMD